LVSAAAVGVVGIGAAVLVLQGGGTDEVAVEAPTSAAVDVQRRGDDTAASIEQLVQAAFAALAASEWDEASTYFFAGGATLGDPSVEWSDQVDQMVAAEPGLIAQGDVAAVLESWCADYSGACSPVAEILGTSSNPAGRNVTVRLQSSDGGSIRLLDGTDVVTLPIGSFEGQFWIADLPPKRAG
jgi:hypothetical protein